MWCWGEKKSWLLSYWWKVNNEQYLMPLEKGQAYVGFAPIVGLQYTQMLSVTIPWRKPKGCVWFHFLEFRILEPRIFPVLSKCSPPKPHSQPSVCFLIAIWQVMFIFARSTHLNKSFGTCHISEQKCMFYFFISK